MSIHYSKTVRHMLSIFAIIISNEHIYLYVFVCFVLVIYYDLQVHSHVMGQIDIHFNTSAMDRHCRDRCLHHQPYKMKICIEGLIILFPHNELLSQPFLSSSVAWLQHYFCAGKVIMPLHKNNGLATLDWSCMGITNCVAHCVSIILSGLYYRFSSCRGVDEEIDHNDSDLCLKCWSKY